MTYFANPEAVIRIGPDHHWGLISTLIILAILLIDSPRAHAGGCQPRGAIERSEYLAADGANLYLLTRGPDCNAPVILWLHGGPGGAERPLFRLYNSDLEDHFIVAYWDQRGAGRSFSPAADPQRLTVDQHLQDLDLVVDHLRTMLRKDNIILIGHSWGSALGLLYAKDHPEKIRMFIGVNQFVAGLDTQQVQFAFALKEAKAREDASALRTLDQIGRPPVDAEHVLKLQGLVDRYGGYFHNRPSFTAALLKGIGYGYVTPWEIPSFIEANNVSLAAMHHEILSLDLRRRVPSVDVPVVFMLGRYDRQLEAQLAEKYFTSLTAPAKFLIWFENSAHNVPFEEPDKFVSHVREAINGHHPEKE